MRFSLCSSVSHSFLFDMIPSQFFAFFPSRFSRKGIALMIVIMHFLFTIYFLFWHFPMVPMSSTKRLVIILHMKSVKNFLNFHSISFPFFYVVLNLKLFLSSSNYSSLLIPSFLHFLNSSCAICKLILVDITIQFTFHSLLSMSPFQQFTDFFLASNCLIFRMGTITEYLIRNFKHKFFQFEIY